MDEETTRQDDEARRLAAILAFPVLIFLGAYAPSSAQRLGPEFQVNSYTAGDQLDAAAAMDASGRFVVVWSSQVAGSRHLFGRRFDTAGSPVAAEFQVNNTTVGDQWDPNVRMSSAGEFLVVWDGAGPGDSDSGVFGRLYDSSGSPVGNEFRVNSATVGGQFAPELAIDSAGSFVVVWMSEDQDGSGSGVFGQRLSPTGSPIGSEFQVNVYTTGSQVTPAVAMDAAGNALVVWASVSQDASRASVNGRLYDSDGIPQGGEFQINADSTDSLSDPAVAVDSAGDFLVVWARQGDAATFSDVLGRSVGNTGSLGADEFRVNLATAEMQRGGRVAADADGNFVVVWHSLGNQDGSYSGIFARRLDGTGVPIQSEFQVNSFTAGNQYLPALAGDGAGSFAVAWMSDGQDGEGNGVFGQRLALPVFVDGFEAGLVCRWSASAGSPDLCL